MIEIRETRLVRQEIVRFKANETGKEFNTEKECTDYEARRRVLAEQISHIEHCAELDGCSNCDGGENYESHDYKWYRPKNKEEIDVLNEYYEGERQLYDDCINTWVCIDLRDDVIDYYTTIEDGLSHASFILEKLSIGRIVLNEKTPTIT